MVRPGKENHATGADGLKPTAQRNSIWVSPNRKKTFGKHNNLGETQLRGSQLAATGRKTLLTGQRKGNTTRGLRYQTEIGSAPREGCPCLPLEEKTGTVTKGRNHRELRN